jgi:ribosomal protein S18 acetylase RimI-like enzyme
MAPHDLHYLSAAGAGYDDGALPVSTGEGAAVLRLTVAEDNEHAAALYRRNRFTETGGVTGPLPDGIRIEQIMVRQSRPPASGV